MGPWSVAGALSGALAGNRPVLLVGLAAAAVGALAAAWSFPPSWIAASAVLAGTMGAIAAEDFRRFRVPNALSLLAALSGLIAVWAEALTAGTRPVSALGGAVLSAILCGGALFLVREAFLRLRGVDGLGLGDVKLAAAGGIWLGWELFPTAVTLAAFGALGFVASRTLLEGPWPPNRRIPFALYLAPSIWFCWFGARLLDA